MAINSAIQQLSGGVASAVAGMIVVQSSTGELQNYGWLGIVVLISMVFATIMMWRVDQYVKHHPQPAPPAVK
jgi:NH3-dependent NAD+ synthetase